MFPEVRQKGGITTWTPSLKGVHRPIEFQDCCHCFGCLVTAEFRGRNCRRRVPDRPRVNLPPAMGWTRRRASCRHQSPSSIPPRRRGDYTEISARRGLSAGWRSLRSKETASRRNTKDLQADDTDVGTPRLLSVP